MDTRNVEVTYLSSDVCNNIKQAIKEGVKEALLYDEQRKSQEKATQPDSEGVKTPIVKTPGEYSTIQEEAIMHYIKMILFALFRYIEKPTERPSLGVMFDNMETDWQGNNCSYCKRTISIYHNTCSYPCQLGPANICGGGATCCGGHWAKLRYATNWLSWASEAFEILKYIVKHG